MERYQNIEQALHKELSKIDKKMESEGTDMSTQDLEIVDKLFHALKSAETYYAMGEGGEMSFRGSGYSGYGGSGNYSGNSYARGRDGRGRYTSREMSRDGGYSGHYPPYYPEFEGGRW